MPKKNRLNRGELQEKLKAALAHFGPASASELCQKLSVSQPAFSRIVASLTKDILTLGRGRTRKYARRREISGLEQPLSLYEIDESGKSLLLGELHAIWPKGFLWRDRVFEDLPFFLEDLRPAGFLGRLIPRLHPEVGFPNDVSMWSADHCVRYFSRYGWNLLGNLLIGEEAFARYLEDARIEPEFVLKQKRANIYPKLAADILNAGTPGSSAGGEQPKFLATKGPEYSDVLVKFSPPRSNSVGWRIADLLVCEHLALETLRGVGCSTSVTELVEGEGGQIFLEVERFDRLGRKGRRGLVSLRAINLEYVGNPGASWVETAHDLLRMKLIDEGTLNQICFFELFGKLIANSDMHLGNLSFYTHAGKIKSLAPLYDMLPMLYAPLHGQILDRDFVPRPPKQSEFAVWERARGAAFDFWLRASKHKLISKDFRAIAKENAQKLQLLALLDERIPR